MSTLKKKSNDKILSNHIIRLGEYSYSMEVMRGDSISGFASQLLTAIALISIALVTTAPTVGNAIQSSWLLFAYFVVFALLIASTILCLISQFRFKYKTLVSPKDASTEIENSNKVIPFETEADAAIHFCESIQDSYLSLRRKNNIANKLLRVAVTLLIVCCVCIFVFMVAFCIAYCFTY